MHWHWVALLACISELQFLEPIVSGLSLLYVGVFLIQITSMLNAILFLAQPFKFY